MAGRFFHAQKFLRELVNLLNADLFKKSVNHCLKTLCLLSLVIGDAVCAFGGPAEDCGKICGQGFREGYCGGGLIILLFLGFLFYAFVKMSNESFERHASEMRQRRYEELQATRRQVETKLNLYNISSIRAKAEAGDADAQFRLGVAYIGGVNVGADEAEGMYWLKKSAAQGNINADKAIYNLQQAKAKAQREQLDFEMWSYLYQADEMARKRDEDLLRKIKRGY